MTKEDDEKLARLREALIEGERSGEPEPFDFDTFIKERLAPIERKRRPAPRSS